MNKRMAPSRALALLLALLTMASVFAGCGEKAPSGGEQKTIAFTVVHGDGSEKEFSIETTADTLRPALEQEKLIEGEEGEFGLFVKTVDGETADEEKEEWWCLTKGGEAVMTGVDSTEIADGDAYEFTLTVGY